MRDWPDAATQHRLRSEGRGLAALLRVPLHRRVWEGRAGNWSGAGRGTSLDFHDQRPYLPGDDPRHVNWQAYARTDQLTMKLFHEEVSPTVDLVFDASRSMLAPTAKRDRAFGLAFFLLESLMSASCSLRTTFVAGDVARGMAGDQWNRRTLEAPAGLGTGDGILRLDRVLLRPGSLRLLITDGLFPGPPDEIARKLSRERGRGIVFAPWSDAEAEPDWNGPLELIDCETRASRREHMGENGRRSYRRAYLRHFESWRDACHKRNLVLTRVAASGSLSDALQPALGVGALEPLP